MKKNKYLFWITGLPGSGKTTIAKKIHKKIEKKYGPTIEISGDDLRKNFLFNQYDLKNRKIYVKYSRFWKYLIVKVFNVIFSTVSLFHDVQKWNKKNINNYYEIFIQSDVDKIIKLNKKKIYSKRKKNLIGVNLNAEFPKKPNFKIKNNFNKSVEYLSTKIIKNIYKDCK